MNALCYLSVRSFINSLKRAFRKPVTYFYILLLAIYAVMIPIGMGTIVKQLSLNTAEGFVVLVTVFCFWLQPVNLISFAKRKGMLFRKSDVHFLFASPLQPKLLLMYKYVKLLGVSLLMEAVVLLTGIFLFDVTLLQLFLYFLAGFILNGALEVALMLLCYGSERITERGRKCLIWLSYAILFTFIAIGLVVYFDKGLSMESILYFIHSDAVQMVPVVGWYIGLIHLIFLGATPVNLVCSILFFVVTVGFAVMAVSMKCNGGYYEDAEKFADDYEEVREKQKEGVSVSMGKKQTFKKATVTYKGGGAKAIFYRQLLEYKKSKAFFLDTSSLIVVVLGIVLAIYMSEGEELVFRSFVVPGVMAYLVFCTSAMTGKWGKEMKNPYTFLIPDSAFHKLWYATLCEHIKNLVYGLLLAVPCAFLLQTSPLVMIQTVLLYMMLQANKLYTLVLVEAWLGNVIGKVGKQLFHMLLQSIPIMLSGIGAIAGVLLSSLEVGFLLMSLIMAACVIAFATLASFGFEKMETA